jgi:hypothetical protein
VIIVVGVLDVRSGIIILSALAALSVATTACQPASIEGTSYAKGTKNTRSSSAGKASGEDAEATETAEDPLTTTPPPSSGADAGQIAVPPPITPNPPAPPPAPPPVTHPNCQSGNPLTCLDCCLGANPQAVAHERAYDDCVGGCFDSACDQQCQNQHVAACAANAACSQNHACMKANNCLAQNFCD